MARNGKTGNLLRVERHEHIHNKLLAEEVVRVSDLSKELGVSPVTIRADLEYLERQGLARRTHGGAVLVRGTQFERTF